MGFCFYNAYGRSLFSNHLGIKQFKLLHMGQISNLFKLKVLSLPLSSTLRVQIPKYRVYSPNHDYDSQYRNHIQHPPTTL